MESSKKIFYIGIFICSFLTILIFLFAVCKYSVLHTVDLVVENNKMALILGKDAITHIDEDSLSSIDLVFNKNETVNLNKSNFTIVKEKNCIKLDYDFKRNYLRQKIKIKLNYYLLKIIL